LLTLALVLGSVPSVNSYVSHRKRWTYQSL
jgi:hypothetical protein